MIKPNLIVSPGSGPRICAMAERTCPDELTRPQTISTRTRGKRFVILSNLTISWNWCH